MARAALIESAVLTEASPLIATPEGVSEKGIWFTRIIEADVEGSSGFYPAEVLRTYGPSAFPAGTHVYLDHPTADEEHERPERSVRDLAGFLVDDARFEEGPNGRGLFARIQFTEDQKDRIKSLAPVLGLSIRAAGDVAQEADGRRVVRSISQGLSVDVVTRAGAGGRLVTMTESTTPGSPPVEQAAPSAGDGVIPSTSGTGALLSEVAAMRTTLADNTEQQAIENTRMHTALKESQRLVNKLLEENKQIRESISSINERQETVDAQMSESKQVGQVVAELIKAGLPVASLVRIAESYRADQDLHAKIQGEKEYLKKILRESERGDAGERIESGLGLSESLMGGVESTTKATRRDEDFSEMDAVLSGKLL